jgi:hypothetical protein
MKKSFGVSVMLISALAMAGVMAAPASAVAPVQTCPKLTAAATLSPGIKNAASNQTLTAKGSLSGCTVATTTGGAGTLTASVKIAAASCAKLATGGQKLSGTGATTWKNKKVSKYALTFTTGTGKNLLIATITGKVSSGLFVGKKVSGAVKFHVNGSPDCQKTAVKSISVVQSKPFVIS